MSHLKLTRVVAAVCLLALVSVPAFAQIELSGTWQRRLHEDWIDRLPGLDPVDYTGVPLNDEGRAKSLSHTYSIQSLTERQCLYYSINHIVVGPQGLRIWSEADPVTGRIVAWKISAAVDRDIVTIWMDGRPHPSPNAFYPFSGFTTGVWEGDTLTAYTTHMKTAYLKRSNGVPASDETTITWHITRHDNLLTMTAIFEDPVYLAEPYVLSRSWVLDPRTNINATSNPCFSANELPQYEVTGPVPHFLPGENPNVNEMTQRYNIPLEAVLGHPETTYPEYRKKMKATYVAPAACDRYCCGWEGNGGPDTAPTLSCITNGGLHPLQVGPGRIRIPSR